MPIKIKNRKRYPADWLQIRSDILRRAGACCEQCGVANYAVGYRAADGRFIPALDGNQEPIIGDSYLNATWWAHQCTEWDEHGRRYIVIVLTVAHLDHVPENVDHDNLKALCQRCHNRHDVPHRLRTRLQTLNARLHLD